MAAYQAEIIHCWQDKAIANCHRRFAGVSRRLLALLFSQEAVLLFLRVLDL